MGIKEKLEEKIKKKEQEIHKYRQKISEAEAYLQGLQEALKMLPRNREDGRPAEQLLRPGSKIFKTMEFLKRQGKPMHVNEIIKGIGLTVTNKEKTSLSGSLGWYVRRGEIFNRPAPNTFGLIDMEKEQIEPPEGFGIEGDNNDIDDGIPF